MSRTLCSECKSPVLRKWNFCAHCGEKFEFDRTVSEGPQNTKYGRYVILLLIAVMLGAPLVNIVKENDGNLLSRLKNRGVLSWNDDTTSEGLLSSGQYAPQEAISTATGSCRIWIYDSEKSANDALDNYINDNLEFSAAWSGVDEKTKTGVVLLTLEPKSYCSEEAASFLEWNLE